MEFKEKLVFVREKMLISQKELSRQIGVSFATINRLEQGIYHPSLKTRVLFEKFCDTNGIAFEEQQ